MRKRRILLIGLVACLLALMTPIAWIETSCMSPRAADPAPYRSLVGAEDQRPETNTYVTYPEWLIVHVYEDYASIARSQGEAAFPYFSSVDRYWSNLCVMTRQATAQGEITGDSKAMLYTIGVSFSVEMAIKGAYEHTVGWLTEAVARNKPTPEDSYSRDVADDYAVFLVQTPWYAYPFWQKLRSFWADVPWRTDSIVRSVERRASFTLEFGAKALYAKAIEAAAGVAPAPRRIRTVVRGWNASVSPLPNVEPVTTLAGGEQVIETPRYRDYTHILRHLALGGVEFVEIAGNDDIFITVFVPNDAPLPGGKKLITAQVPARLGMHREGLLVKVPELAGLVRRLETSGGALEHVYEY